MPLLPSSLHYSGYIFPSERHSRRFVQIHGVIGRDQVNVSTGAYCVFCFCTSVKSISGYGKSKQLLVNPCWCSVEDGPPG